MQSQYLFDLDHAVRRENVGSKASKLQLLPGGGFTTPRAFVCTWDAHQEYKDGREEIITVLRSEIEHTLDLDCAYAIRSSANLEDGLERSFAGQFKSVLNVRGVDEILQAIWSVWASTDSPGVVAYLDKMALGPSDLHMAVILQEMVDPVVSGVAFSKNPLTGMDEIIVEAVEGSGELLVQDGITPSRWIHKWGAWIVEPETEGTQPDLLEQVVRETKAIAAMYGRPVDLEWVFDGQELYWVQLREITAADINVYSNHISREVFPGIIKPLVWSVNVPLVNGAWVRLIRELIGPNDIDPDSLAKCFYYRAYFNMGALGRVFEALGMPRETLELLMGIDIGGPEKPSFRPGRQAVRHLARMLRLVADKLAFERRIRRYLPGARERFAAFRAVPTTELTERELLNAIDGLFPVAQEAAYFNIVTPLLMQVYTQVLKARLQRLGVDYESIDLTKDLFELKQYQPNVHLDALHQLYIEMDEQTRMRVKETSYAEFLQLSDVAVLQREFVRFMDDFGHLSDSGNDFSEKPWREDPDLILRMMIDYHAPGDASSDAVRFDDLDLPSVRKLFLRPIYHRARRFKLHREAVSSLYTYGYGLFRDYFLELGSRFVERGVLLAREDIFFLQFDEVRSVVLSDETDPDYRERIDERKAEIEECRKILPPTVIFGDEALPVHKPADATLKGTPTSRGIHTGRARVVQGIRDFPKLKDGDVLVIPFSDVGWTPLFTRAGAVVAESGGILSHSSIVAREYGIPAVVSVPGACQLDDGAIVTVDGFQGEIIVHAEARDETPHKSVTKTIRSPEAPYSEGQS
jgi:phosphohistidine swiveling domain-containing protein